MTAQPRITRPRRTSLTIAALAPLLALTACGTDLEDPESVASGFVKALFLDRDCEDAAEFVDESVADDFEDSCDADDVPKGIEVDDDETTSDTEDDYSYVEFVVAYEEDGDEEEGEITISLERNGSDEWEVNEVYSSVDYD